MYKIWLPLLIILTGVILCLKRNYPDKYMSTPSYPRQTMDRHFAMINMIRDTESKIKHKWINPYNLTAVGTVLVLAGIILAIAFYYMP